MHESHVDNLTLNIPKSKQQLRSHAIEAGKNDKDCIRLKSFTLIKSRRAGLYDYTPGTSGILFADDIPHAEYVLGDNGKWTHTTDCYDQWKKRQDSAE